MSPDMPKYRPTYMSFPRVSGDEPPSSEARRTASRFSPRERG